MDPLSCKLPLEKNTDPNAKKESIVLRGTKKGVNIIESYPKKGYLLRVNIVNSGIQEKVRCRRN